jgi:hypothetical protein
MEAIFCSNEECRFHTERKGGRFHFRNGLAYCEDCFRPHLQLDDCKNLYEFETPHFTGERIQVQNRRHLERLEQQHGVVHVQNNYYEKNWAPTSHHTPVQPTITGRVNFVPEAAYGKG